MVLAGGTLPLTFLDANLCTINGQTATPGISIINNTNVHSGPNTIEIHIDKNIISETIYNGQTVYAYNQRCITLKDLTNNSNVLISVYRLGDGSPTDPEKQHLFFDANLVSGHSYEIRIDASLIANNGLQLGTTKYVNFTVAAPIPAPVNKTALTTAITNATTLIGSKTIGTAVGNVSQAAHDAYNTAIVNATVVKNNAIATQGQVNTAMTSLAAATTTFNNAKS